jgi:hypothetical protein
VDNATVSSSTSEISDPRSQEDDTATIQIDKTVELPGQTKVTHPTSQVAIQVSQFPLRLSDFARNMKSGRGPRAKDRRDNKTIV